MVLQEGERMNEAARLSERLARRAAGRKSASVRALVRDMGAMFVLYFIDYNFISKRMYAFSQFDKHICNGSHPP